MVESLNVQSFSWLSASLRAVAATFPSLPVHQELCQEEDTEGVYVFRFQFLKH